MDLHLQDRPEKGGIMAQLFKLKLRTLLGVFLLSLPLMYIGIALVLIDEGHVGIVFAKIGSKPSVEDRFIVEAGEKGYQREVLMPGMRFYWFLEPFWKYTITEEPFIKIPPGMIGVVNANEIVEKSPQYRSMPVAGSDVRR